MWAVRLGTLALWMVAGASCIYWGLRLAPRTVPAPVAAPARQTFAADPTAISRLLGANPLAAGATQPTVSLASRFNLLGVVASRSHTGAALIAVDGKPARPYRVGSPLDEGLMLQSVQGRKAVIAASAGGPAVLTLELPPIKH